MPSRSRILPALALLLASLPVFAGDSSSSSLTLSGVVPAVVSASLSMDAGALVFRQGERVRGRPIGRIHLKYNTPLGAVLIAANQDGGLPSNEDGPYPFGPAGFSISVGACQGVDPSRSKPIRFGPAGSPTDIGRREPLTRSVVADCALYASWDGASPDAAIPEGSSYGLGLSISLVPAE